MDKKDLIQKEINVLISLYKSRKYKVTIEKIKILSKEFKNVAFLFNLMGMAQINLNEYENSIFSFKKALEIDAYFAEAYNNLATSYINLGEFQKAIDKLKLAIDIKPEYSNAYNNLASAYSDLGDYENALISFNKVLKINPKYPKIEENIIKMLTFYTPKNYKLNEITQLDYLIKKIKLNHGKKEILDEDVIKIYKEADRLVSNKLDNLKYDFSQIWRRNDTDLNCTRHFTIFRNFNVIPEYCFSCFKVQIEMSSITALFKLFLVFNDLNLNNNKSRKCLIELRNIGKGTYKGIIYCTGYEEAKSIFKLISDTLKSQIKDKGLNLELRRGCTEFGLAYPDYKDLNKPPEDFMKYNENWKDKENFIDKNYPKKNRINQRNLNDTLSQISLNDFLVMKNWIMYAKKIGDENYKKFDENIVISEYIEKELASNLISRISEFNKNKTSS